MQKSQNRYFWKKNFFRISANSVNTYPFVVFPSSSFLLEVLIQNLNSTRADNQLLYASSALLVVYARKLVDWPSIYSD